MSRLLLLLALWLSGATAQAHTMSVSHLQVSTSDRESGARLELDLAVRDLALTLPLDANGDDQVTWGELTAIRAQIEQLVTAQVQVASGDRGCPLLPGEFALRRYDDGAYAALTMDARCDRAGPISIGYRLFFERDPQHRALVTVRHAGNITTAIASPAAPTVTIGDPSSQPFLDFLREGIHHILIGYDHLAFLISLLLPAVLRREGGKWQPVASFRIAVGHIVAIVTAFTLAHSITLTAAALGWVTPASRWVEAAIAASVLLAALNNIWPLVTRRIWLVGFAFGLVHGFGFAGALSELGLPAGARVVALLGFNLGVEIGQLAVVALTLPLLFVARRTRWYARAGLPAASLAIAALAGWWLIQRLLP